jgi:hypothetical protein
LLRHLNIDEMVGVIAPWVIDPKRKALFLSIPEIAAQHSKVIEAHTDLLAARPATTAMSPELRQVTDAEAVVDDRHDHLARAIHVAINADAELGLAGDPPDKTRSVLAEEIDAKLFPTGLNITNASFLAESGNTARVAQLLKAEPAIAAFLKSIPMRGKTTLLAMTEHWIETGAELGKLERKREELEAQEATKPVDKAKLNSIRGKTIRLLSLVQANLEESSAPPVAIETIRGPITKASERAAKRYATTPEGTDGGTGGGSGGAPPPGGSGGGTA